MLSQATCDMSFSGVKTAVRTHLLDATAPSGNRLFADDTFWPMPTEPCWEQQRNDILASFQQAVADALVAKTLRAATQVAAKAIVVVGGVACNSALRLAMQQAASSQRLPVFFPSPRFCTDNAAMIAYTAAYRYNTNPAAYDQHDFLDLDADLNFSP
jgi:N6-L-threonylcarbamoyladenine synthase